MDEARVLLIGAASDGRFAVVPFINGRNLSEIDAIVWSPHAVASEWKGREGEFHKRYLEIVEWVKSGQTLIVLGPIGGKLEYHEWDATKRQNERRVLNFATSQLFSGVRFVEKHGHSVSYVGPDHPSFEMHVGAIGYSALMLGDGFVPLLTVGGPRGGREFVGGYRRVGEGLVIFVPYPGTERDYYFTSLLELAPLLKEQQSELPEWAASFQTAAERDARIALDDLTASIAKIQKQMGPLSDAIDRHQFLKHLFTSKDEDFSQAVATALTELGLKVVAGPKAEADLLAWDGKRVLAIEAKGLEGSAKRKNVTQSWGWKGHADRAQQSAAEDLKRDVVMQAYKEKLSGLGVSPEPNDDADTKAVAVIGTYRKTPLDQRTGADFPGNAVDEAARHGVCLLTGLQLLGMLLAVRSGALKKSAAIESLFATTGVLPEFATWNGFLSKH